MSRNCLIGWVTLWLTTTIPSPWSMEYYFSYHNYPWLCLFKISFPARGHPFPGVGVHPGDIPNCHWPLGMSAWENNLVSSSMLWLSSLQLHRTSSPNGSMCFRVPACSGEGSQLAVPPGRLSLSCPAHHVPQHVRTFSCPFPFPCLSLSPAALSHHSTTPVWALSAAALPLHSVPATDGANQGTGAKLQPGLPGCWGSTHTPAPISHFCFDKCPGLFLLQTGDAPGFLAAFQLGEFFHTQLELWDMCTVPGKCKFFIKSYIWRQGFTTRRMEMRWLAAACSHSLISGILFLAEKKEHIF